jgi:hypothetical protein
MKFYLVFFFAIFMFGTSTEAQTPPPPNCGFPQTLGGVGRNRLPPAPVQARMEQQFQIHHRTQVLFSATGILVR